MQACLLAGNCRFRDLTEQHALASAIASKAEGGRVFAAYAARLRADCPSSAAVFERMSAQEDEHRQTLIDAYRRRFGDIAAPLHRECTASGCVNGAARQADVSRRAGIPPPQTKPSGPPAQALDERDDRLPPEFAERPRECPTARRQFILTWVQPGLAGLMDGSVSTLAPIFATAFATHDSWTTLLVGLSAALGAGISMGFTEAASDDGRLSGRGSPWKRGLASGVMTTIGGLGHAVPYFIPYFSTATALALMVVFVELWAIVWIQNRYMETPFLRATFQVVLGGGLVLAAGILIGSV